MEDRVMAREVTRRRATADPAERTARRSAPRDADEDYEQDEPDTQDEGRSRRSARRSSRELDDTASDREVDRESRGRSGRAPRGSEKVAEVAGEEGWDGYRNTRAKTSTFNAEDVLTVGDKPVIIKCLQDGPFFTYQEHWVERGKGKGQRSFTCPGASSCALHEIGQDRTRAIALMNVADTADGAQKYWKMGPNAADALGDLAEELAEENRSLSDDDVYVRVTRKQNTNGFYSFKCSLVEDSRVDEPFDSSELGQFEDNLFDRSVIKATSYDILREIADEILDRE
jgi:hypothetical protein